MTGHPDNAGWIEWKGGECPVAPDTMVEVHLSGGMRRDGMSARGWSWKHFGNSGDIVAYRLSDRLADESPEARYKTEVDRVNRATDAEIGLATSKPLPAPPTFDPATVCKPSVSAIAGAIERLTQAHTQRARSALITDVLIPDLQVLLADRAAQALRIKALEDGLRVCLGHLTGGMDGDWRSTDPVELALRLLGTEGRDDG